MSLIDRVLTNLEDRRQRILDGKINCIPCPFKGLRRDFPGIEQGTYILVSGGTKSGKTQITNYMFLFVPLLYAYNHPDLLRIQFFYYPLEETPEKITLRFMSFLLYILSNRTIRVSPQELQSTDKDRVLDYKVLELLHSIEYQSILRFFEDHVHFMSSRNPSGVYKDINAYAEEAGTVHKKKIIIENKQTGIKQEREVFDYYEPKDPNEYVVIIWDHGSLVSPERDLSLKGSIDKLSEYFMILRNKYRYIPVLIQQQNSENLGLEAFKANKIRPTYTGLGDSKNPGKD